MKYLALFVVGVGIACAPPVSNDVAELQAPDAEHSNGACPDSEQAASVEAQFVSLINSERVAAGRAPLAPYWDLTDDARVWADAMRDAGGISHNPSLVDVTTGWNKLGENVGVGGSVSSLHDAFMASPGHAANILNTDYGYVGIGAIVDGPTLWVTEDFMAADSAPTHLYPPFSDDDGLVHERNIWAIYCAGITVGCGGDRFCPQRAVTRAEMAVFLTRALALPASSTDWFDDDDGTWYESSVDALAAAEITLGCNPPQNDRYCPTDPVTRGQMAAFLVRALDLPPAVADHFSDDAGRFYEPAANSLKEAGITVGCGPQTYCGEEPVTRAEMATFLARALGL